LGGARVLVSLALERIPAIKDVASFTALFSFLVMLCYGFAVCSWIFDTLLWKLRNRLISPIC